MLLAAGQFIHFQKYLCEVTRELYTVLGIEMSPLPASKECVEEIKLTSPINFTNVLLVSN